MKPCYIVLASLLLSGCATLSETDCRSGDWYGVGLQDGQSGSPLSLLSAHREACNEFGINIDGDRYRQGREKGLLQYCTPENGARAGRSGESYSNVCPPGMESEFLRQYRFGHKIWEAEKALEQINSRMQEIDNQLERKDLSDDARHRLFRERSDLRADHGNRERELRILEAVDLVR